MDLAVVNCGEGASPPSRPGVVATMKEQVPIPGARLKGEAPKKLAKLSG